jgi:hypothetical protein
MKSIDEKIIKIKGLLSRFNPPIEYSIEKISEKKIKFKAPKHIIKYVKESLKEKPLKEAYKEDKIVRAKSEKYENTEYILEEIGGKLYITRDIDSQIATVSVDSPIDIQNISKEELVSLGDRINDEMRFGL